MIRKEDGEVNWASSAESIFNKMRGFTPWPSAFTRLDGKLFKILKAMPYNGEISFEQGLAGEVYAAKNTAFVKCGKGVLQLVEVQLEGKKALDIASFLSGGKLKSGMILGK